MVQLMGLLYCCAGIILWAMAVIQAADALGKIEVRFYPFVRSDSNALKWVNVAWQTIGGFMAIGFGLFLR